VAMDPVIAQRLRRLPAVHDVASDPLVATRLNDVPERFSTGIIRDTIDRARKAVLAGDGVGRDDIIQQVAHELDGLFLSEPKVVINATGVVIHTNLGRAPVSKAAAESMALAARHYQALEMRLESGDRGGRGEGVSKLMRILTGAERTLVVNNNAAAVMLTLAATSTGREVVVSRGEAVEIGGGFRIPDVLRQSGARLVEVGTTNRTYARDYANATTLETSAYLKVHASNFAISGFTASVSVEELAPVAREAGVLLIEDVGSGCLLDTRQFGLDAEPLLSDSIAAGVDVVCASGDKLLGGPQAGLILGRAAVIDRISRHPLARSLRADKTCLAGLETTLRHYLLDEATETIPVWWSMSRPADWLEQRVREWVAAIDHPAVNLTSTASTIGGGSLPGKTQPSFGLAIQQGGRSASDMATLLRTGKPAVVPRVQDDMVILDARTVLPDEDEALIGAVRALLES
jgi:L-seryl-tRNA(Ser) seleniumtransferase